MAYHLRHGERVTVTAATSTSATGPRSLLTWFHGTAASTVPLVLTDGIRRRGRRYVHLSTTITAARRVGARHGRPAVLRVAAARMAADGFPLLRATAGTWLADVVPSAYLTVAY